MYSGRRGYFSNVICDPLRAVAESNPGIYFYCGAAVVQNTFAAFPSFNKAKPKIEVNADLSGFSTIYGDTFIQYQLEWNGDNVTLKDPPKEE